jgi:hypothetical protein
MSLLVCHDQINPDRLMGNEKKCDVFTGYMHLEPLPVGPKRFDIPMGMRVIRQPVDMFTNDTAIFFWESCKE